MSLRGVSVEYWELEADVTINDGRLKDVDDIRVNFTQDMTNFLYEKVDTDTHPYTLQE